MKRGGAQAGSRAQPLAEPLGADFFDRSVHLVARELIGCRLLFEGRGGVIVETESYERDDPACHAYAGLTERTRVLFGPPGRSYVYLSYGIHSLLNFVAEPEGEAAAVLIRALQPTSGVEEMRSLRGARPDHDLCSGPGKLTEALGVGLAHNDADLSRDPFRLLPPEPGLVGRDRRRPTRRHHQSRRAPLALLRGRQPERLETPAAIQPAVTPPPPAGAAGSAGAGSAASGSVGASSGAGSAGAASSGASLGSLSSGAV